jgi:AcrR family transcriptional regulator
MAYDAKKTRQIILDTAYKEFHTNGFRATGINEILKKAGLTKGAFYHHFETKLDLGYAIVEEFLFNRVKNKFLNHLTLSDDPIDGLKEIFTNLKYDEAETMQGCPINNLAVEMAPIDEGFRRRLEDVYDRWMKEVAKALEQGRQNGYVDKRIDSSISAAFIVSAMAGCRSVAKNAKSSEMLGNCFGEMTRYLDSLRPATCF